MRTQENAAGAASAPRQVLETRPESSALAESVHRPWRVKRSRTFVDVIDSRGEPRAIIVGHGRDETADIIVSAVNAYGGAPCA